MASKLKLPRFWDANTSSPQVSFAPLPCMTLHLFCGFRGHRHSSASRDRFDPLKPRSRWLLCLLCSQQQSLALCETQRVWRGLGGRGGGFKTFLRITAAVH